jgi:hypothetical protein
VILCKDYSQFMEILVIHQKSCTKIFNSIDMGFTDIILYTVKIVVLVIRN